MPAINSAQLSDISERTEYTAKSQLNKSHQQQHEKYGSGNLDNSNEKRDSLERRRRSECAIDNQRVQSSNYASDGEISDNDKSSPNSVIENPNNKDRNEIEINIHQASTISEEYVFKKKTMIRDHF